MNTSTYTDAFSDIATRNFKRWMDALEFNARPETIAKLYHGNGTLHPTFEIRKFEGPKDIVSYFEGFLQHTPTVTIESERISPLSETAYLHEGIYVFVIDRNLTVRARFTFIWTRQNETGKEDWKILHHHSSRIPLPKRCPNCMT